MFTIVFATQKGGSGKSTVAVNLAVALAERGRSVVLVDLDRQGTATDWRRARTADHPRLCHDIAHAAGADVAIIDTPGVDSPATTAAMRAADLVLVPVRPSVPDLRGSLPTIHALVRIGKPFAFVLNQCPVRAGSRLAETRAGLAALGIVAEPPIAARVTYQDAMAAGLGVTEYAPSSPAAEEIRALARWIEENRQ